MPFSFSQTRRVGRAAGQPFSRRDRRSGVGVTAALALLLLVGAAAYGSPTPALINESRSLPRGLYLRTWTKPHRGAVVALKPPPWAQDFLRGQGAPEDLRLLKRIAAVPGDHVCIGPRGVIAPQRIVHAQSKPEAGPRLPPHLARCGPLGPDEVVVLGETAGSFDSRYFGAVNTDDLEGVFKALWTW